MGSDPLTIEKATAVRFVGGRVQLARRPGGAAPDEPAAHLGGGMLPRVNDHALGLFATHGYIPVPSYLAGRNPAINRAFAKPLHVPRD